MAVVIGSVTSHLAVQTNSHFKDQSEALCEKLALGTSLQRAKIDLKLQIIHAK